MEKGSEEVDGRIDGVMPLWAVSDLARYLKRSQRWVWSQLDVPGKRTGRIPHLRIGKAPRFIPEEIFRWVRLGCPSVADFDSRRLGS